MNLDFARNIKHKLLGHPEFRNKKVDLSAAEQEHARCSQRNDEFDFELRFSEVFGKFDSANRVYHYMHHYLHQRAPRFLQEHREYYSQERRGFGEDAMHAMWWLLFAENRPTNCLEIGVYRGQVISVWSLIAKFLSIDVNAWGISPLSPIGDDASGGYLDTVNYEDDIRNHFAHFEIGQPQLCKALSTDDKAKELCNSQQWDLIYIDGSHDYDIVMSDYHMCKAQLAPNGLLIFDDAAANIDYSPPAFAFAGHPDPSKIAAEVVMQEMTFVGNVGHNMIFRNG